jgi:hypothetical protein
MNLSRLPIVDPLLDWADSLPEPLGAAVFLLTAFLFLIASPLVFAVMVFEWALGKDDA